MPVLATNVDQKQVKTPPTQIVYDSEPKNNRSRQKIEVEVKPTKNTCELQKIV